MDNRIKEVILSNDEIVNICARIGKQINEEFAGSQPILVGLLKGCVPFMAELMKHITLDCSTEYMVVSSYHGGTRSSGLAKIVMDIDENVDGKNVILVEDIIDTGRTLKKIKELLEARGANVTLVTLLDKPEGRVVDIEADIVGKVIPNKFVVGFGLDYNECLRNLPYIGVLKEEVYGG